MKNAVFFRAARASVAALALSLGGASLSACSSDEPKGGADADPAQPGDGSGAGTNADAGRDASGPKRDAKASDSEDKPDSGLPPTQPDDGEDKCAGIRKDAPAGMGAVDVIFIIDTSGSMAQVIAQVQANIEGFIKDFEGSSADTHVTLITLQNLAAGTSVENDAVRYRFVSSPVDSRVLFDVALSTFPQYKDFMRPEAATQFVMITDDQDNITADSFNQQMTALLGHPFTQHAIASEDANGAPCSLPNSDADPLCAIPIPVVCTATAIGSNYYSLADATMGEKISICSSDFTAVFERLRSAVIAAVPLPCEYALAEATNPDFDSSKVQVVYTPQGGADQEFPKANDMSQCGDKLGWYYDDDKKPSSLSLCPAACDRATQGGSMDIAFGCTPQMFL